MTSRADFINQQLLLIDGQFAGVGCAKHTKMCASPFVFFRGTAQLFYADLAVHNLSVPAAFLQTPLTTIMGDCHSSNFGFFSEGGSHGEEIIFSLNDFDDACIGFAHWDILRYLVSLVLSADHAQGLVSGKYSNDKKLAGKDYSSKACVSLSDIKHAMHAFIEGYIDILNQGIENKQSDVHFLDATFADFSSPSPLSKRYKKAKLAAIDGELFMSKSALAKAVDLSHFPLRFLDKPDKFVRKGIELVSIHNQLGPYFYQHIHDVVKRVNSGTGSVNLERYYLLIGPKELSTFADLKMCHVVEAKQQRTAAALHYFPDLHHQNSLNPAHLTLKCQRRMQRKQDYCLDEAYYKDRHWLIRSRHHTKVGFDPEHIALGKVNVDQAGFSVYTKACANELARAHARGDRSSLHFERAMLTALASSQAELVDIAFAYAKQVIDDWQWFCQQT